MRKKDQFIAAIKTICFSWGGDTPAEAIWGVNELLDWYEAEYSVSLGIRLDEGADNFDAVLAALEAN